LLVCNDFDQAVATSDRITAALADGELDSQVLVAAARRIDRLPRPASAGESLKMPVAAHTALCERIKKGERS
jgi:hypothetical protein